MRDRQISELGSGVWGKSAMKCRSWATLVIKREHEKHMDVRSELAQINTRTKLYSFVLSF